MFRQTTTKATTAAVQQRAALFYQRHMAQRQMATNTTPYKSPDGRVEYTPDGLVKSVNGKEVSRTRFFKNFKEDEGNLPLIAANIAAAALIAIFAGRKVLFHPDVIVDPNRAPANESPKREQYGLKYHEQTQFFADNLSKVSAPIVNWANKTDHSDDYIWSMRDTIGPKELPLEHTDYFRDGLYKGIAPGEVGATQARAAQH